MTIETRTPPEFVDFVRDIGVRSFDYFSTRITDERSPFHKLATYWNELESEEKSRFFDQLIVGAQVLAASAVVTRLARRPVTRSAKKPPTENERIKVDKKEKKKDKKKADQKKVDVKKAKNKDKKGKKKKAKKAGEKSATPSAS